jgi:hypothetical protein
VYGSKVCGNGEGPGKGAGVEGNNKKSNSWASTHQSPGDQFFTNYYYNKCIQELLNNANHDATNGQTHSTLPAIAFLGQIV